MPTEAALVDLAGRLEAGGIPFVLIREPDPPWHGAAMALGIYPTRDRAAVRRFVSSLPMYGKEKP